MFSSGTECCGRWTTKRTTTSVVLRRRMPCGARIVAAQTVWCRCELSHQTTLIDLSALRSEWPFSPSIGMLLRTVETQFQLDAVQQVGQCVLTDLAHIDVDPPFHRARAKTTAQLRRYVDIDPRESGVRRRRCQVEHPTHQNSALTKPRITSGIVASKPLHCRVNGSPGSPIE